jgi:hypothetical protein
MVGRTMLMTHVYVVVSEQLATVASALLTCGTRIMTSATVALAAVAGERVSTGSS